MKKASANFEAQKLELEGKVEKLASTLSETDKLSIDKDTEIAKLIKERDAAIQISMGLKKTGDENAKKLVLDNIVSTFKLSKVEFKTASAILTDKSTELLDRVSDIMKENTGYNYKIQGHTDSQGKDTSNLKLSQERAESVKNYLISKGVSGASLSTEGFGSSAPIADNATKEGRLLNRRVVFEITN